MHPLKWIAFVIPANNHPLLQLPMICFLPGYLSDVHRPDDLIVVCHIMNTPHFPTFSLKGEYIFIWVHYFSLSSIPIHFLSGYMKDFHRSGDEIVICHIIEPPELPTLSLKRESHTVCLATAYLRSIFAFCANLQNVSWLLFFLLSYLGLNSLLIVRTLPTHHLGLNSLLIL